MRSAILAALVVVSLCGGLVRPALAQGGDNAPIPVCTEDELSFVKDELSSFAQQVFSQIQDLHDQFPDELSQLKDELHYSLLEWRLDINIVLPVCAQAIDFRLTFERLLYESLLSVTLLQLGDTDLADVYLDQLDLLQADIQDELEQLASTSTSPDASMPTAEPTAEPSLRSDAFLHDDSLLTGLPCAAPCWHGIIPGQTTWEEAIQIVSADPTFAGFETNAESGLQQAVWQKAGSGQYCCRLIADDEENATVSYIFIALASGITVSEVLEIQGDPSYITTFPFTDSEYVIQLIYPAKQMVISVVVGDASSSLTASSDVVAMLYMSVEEMDLIIQTTELKAWTGYQAYSAYDQAIPVVTPSVTLTPAY